MSTTLVCEIIYIDDLINFNEWMVTQEWRGEAFDGLIIFFCELHHQAPWNELRSKVWECWELKRESESFVT